MIVIGLAILGVIIGSRTAKKRGGNLWDVAQYGFGYGMAFLIVGMFVTVIIDRIAS